MSIIPPLKWGSWPWQYSVEGPLFPDTGIGNCLYLPRPFTDMTDNRVMLKRLANITYSHADIEATRKFLHDFGFTEVAQIGDRYYYRGYGELPYIYVAEKAEGGKAVFLGAAFEAESKVELEKASKLKVRSLLAIAQLRSGI